MGKVLILPQVEPNKDAFSIARTSMVVFYESEADYKLAIKLNALFKLRLERVGDLVISEDGVETRFPMFFFHDVLKKCVYTLLTLKVGDDDWPRCIAGIEEKDPICRDMTVMVLFVTGEDSRREGEIIFRNIHEEADNIDPIQKLLQKRRDDYRANLHKGLLQSVSLRFDGSMNLQSVSNVDMNLLKRSDKKRYSEMGKAFNKLLGGVSSHLLKANLLPLDWYIEL